MKRLTLSVVILTVLFGGIGPADADAKNTLVDSHPWIGKAAPEFKLTAVGGGELGLKDLKGNYVVVHFGTSW